MDKEKLSKYLKLNPNIIMLDGYDDCIIGLCSTYNGVHILYSEKKLMEKLEKQGISGRDALTYYENEILDKYHDMYSPIFFMDFYTDDLYEP